MAAIQLTGAASLGSALTDLLSADDIVPGDTPSYQLAKVIFETHVLGAKIAENPIALAMSQARAITVPSGPDRVRDKFVETWNAMNVDAHVFNVMRLSRVYGIASHCLVAEGMDPKDPVDYATISDKEISFNVIDPLNSAGSLVLNQDPNAFDFQKPGAIAVNGIPYHRSRAITVLNGSPIYLGYTRSAFGYVGRSAYQRALYPMKSFIGTMVTDDLISQKAGLLVAKIKQPGSIIDNIMAAVAGIKRSMLQIGVTGNVLSVGNEDAIESLNLQNIDGAGGFARKNILENIASGADMPAQLLNEETFAEGFGEGTEDAKKIARYVERVRLSMNPVYNFLDPIVMRKAWTPEWYAGLQEDFPEEFGDVEFNEAFYRFKNSFQALWPNLLEEPDSEKAKLEDVKLKAVIAMVEVFGPQLDPENRAQLIQDAYDNINANKLLFQTPFTLEPDTLLDYAEEQNEQKIESLEEPKESRPFAANDSDRGRRAVDSLTAAVTELNRIRDERRAARK